MAAPSFEKDLEKLEAIVGALEEGGLELDDALKRFEEGIKLAKRCEKALADAEKKIEVLTKNAEGEIEAEPLDTAANSAAPSENQREAPSEKTATPAEQPRAENAPEEQAEDDDEDLLF